MVFPKNYFLWQSKVHVLISCNILFTQFLFSENAIRRYVYDVSKVNLAKNRKTKYFNFTIQTEEDIHNCVSFSPEKRDLLVNISNESSEHIVVEIKKFKPSTESNDLQVTDFTKINKRKLEFKPRLLNLNITKISTIINETGLNEIVHIEGVAFDLKEEKVKIKDGREIRIQECKVKDNTAIIKLTIFGDLTDEVNENSFYKISHLRVAKYDYE